MDDMQKAAMERLKEKGVNISKLTYMQSRSFYEDSWKEKLPNFIYIEELLNEVLESKKD